MLLERLVSQVLRERLALWPAVAIVGPRQAGKTTLSRQISDRYFDLEQPQERVRLDALWGAILADEGGPVVLDEAQAWPEVFARIRGAIDFRPARNGRFLIVGSVSPALMRQVGESLAGRLALVHVSPLLVSELREAAVQTDRRWLAGGYPGGGVIGPMRFPAWQRDYLALLAQRDLPTWGLAAKPATTDRFFSMLAALHGQVWNASSVARSLGLTHPTVNSYLDYLEGAFLVRRLQPFHVNARKRLVKSPKVYWRDSGLLHAIHNAVDLDTLMRQPWVGSSWEGFVIEQVVGTFEAIGRPARPFFFRTYDGQEVDLVLDLGHERWAIEIKLTSAPTIEQTRSLDLKADLLEANRRFLVTRCAGKIDGGRTVVCDLESMLDSIVRERSAG